jgi:uncharacterized protein with ParB-like and HNH nuclease domain
MDIKAKVRSVSELQEYFFVVPDYQREYVWQPEDQVEQFIVDIDNEFDSTSNSGERPNYFIGSIIIVKNTKGKYDVIDGQQRLTTIVLALCAFRNILDSLELDDNQKNYLQSIKQLLYAFDLKTRKTQARLELQYQESQGYLQTLIDKADAKPKRTPSVIKMQQAYDKLKGHFSTISKPEIPEHEQKGNEAEEQGLAINNLIEYAAYFLSQIELVVIESEDLSSALKIFETINQRGVGLNAMDLVKNLLFSNAAESDFVKIKEIWKDIVANLQNCNEKSPLRFLRYFLMARYHNGILREDELYKWIISKEGKELTNYESKPLALAQEFETISKRYSDLVIATEYKLSNGTFPSVTNIGFVNKFKSRQHLIALLSLDVDCSNADVDYLGRQLESFFFYSNTIGIQAKTNERTLVTWAGLLRGKKTQEEIGEVIDSHMIPYIQERLGTFKNNFLSIGHTAYNPLYRLRYILGKIENTILRISGLPQYDASFIDSLQVEHILPQTPKGGLLTDEFADMDTYLNAVYLLGNVTLLESTINQAVNNCNDLQSNWFEKKQSEYLKSTLTSTKLLNHDYQIGDNTALNRFKNEYDYRFNEWTIESIQQRQKVLLQLAFETWKFNGRRIDIQQVKP